MLYFAYGMNLAPGPMEYTYAEKLYAGTLHDHVLKFRGYATVEPKEGEKVQGGVWYVPDSKIWLLDEREGYPIFYDRKFVAIETEENGQVSALVYFMPTPAPLPVSPPSGVYLDMIREGYEYFGLNLNELSKPIAESMFMDES